jgi:hypothetical protein
LRLARERLSQIAIKDVINNEKVAAKKSHLARCAIIALNKFAKQVESEVCVPGNRLTASTKASHSHSRLQALGEAGISEADAITALEYYLHPAVGDAAVQQAVVSMKVASAPTVYSEAKSLDILKDSLSDEAVNDVAPVRGANYTFCMA